MTENDREHFDRISSKYQEAAKSWSEINNQIEFRLNPLVQGAVVLDVGNGSRLSFDSDLCHQVTAMDISPKMLEDIKDPSIIKLTGDAQEMEGIEDGSTDVIVFIMVLHHINGADVKSSLETLDRVLEASRRKLRPGGHLAIAEALLPNYIYYFQNFFFKLERWILGIFDVPMIYFFSRQALTAHITETLGLDPGDVEQTELKLDGWIDPLGGSFPGNIKIPHWLHPLKFRLFIGERRK